MSIGAGTAIALGAGLSAAGSLGGAALSSHGAQSAAKTQAQEAQYAADLQHQEFLQQQQNLAPWLQAGTGALSQLTGAMQPGGQFGPDVTYPGFTPTGAALAALQPGTFQAPTAEQAAAMPGYQFAFDQGLQALQRSQAAAGITGGAAAKAAEKYGQGLASTNYQQAYNNALGVYGANQSAAQNALANQSGIYGTNFNLWNTLQNQAYNRLASMAGIGQSATTQLNQAAGNYAANAGNLLTSGAAATAAGQMGGAQSWAAGLQGIGNVATNLANNLALSRNQSQQPYIYNPSYAPAVSSFGGYNISAPPEVALPAPTDALASVNYGGMYGLRG